MEHASPSRDKLDSYITRAETLFKERELLNGDIRELFAQAKNEGFDTKALRKIIRMRNQDPVKIQEEQAILDLYLSVLGE